MIELKNIEGTHRESVLVGLKHLNLTSGKGRVLEIGCGNCEFKPYFEKFEWAWLGVDKTPLIPGVVFGLAENLPFLNEFADMIFSSHTFEHCENPLSALKESFRVLKTKGTLFLAIPVHSEKMILYSDEDHLFVLTEIQMRKLLSYVGFTEISIWEEKVRDDVIFNSLICIARKP